MTCPSSARIALIALLLGAITGCSIPHHDDTAPQQQFLEALKRGNAPEASQIWLHLSAGERADLSHNVGLKPDVTPAAVKAAMLKAEMRRNNEASGDDTAFQQGDIDSQRLEWPGLDVDSHSLLTLPSSQSEPAQQPPGP
ncbi:MAG: hypothetical protein ACREQ4_10720 [Candidatus Binataceae bacterium]